MIDRYQGTPKKLLTITLALVVLVGGTLAAGASCSTDVSPAEADGIGVVVTLPPLADFVGQVGGDRVDITVMVPEGNSPHDHDPTTEQMIAVSEADIYVKVGSGIEFELARMSALQEHNREMSIIDCSWGIDPIDMGAHHHEGDEGDEEHEGDDPHIWLSPVNAKIMVENICAGLIALDPDNADYYTENKDRYLHQLDDLDSEIRDGLSTIENRHFMVYHPAWGYFAKEYDLEQIPVEVEGNEPTPQQIADLIEEAQEHSIQVVFASPQDVQSANAIAREIGTAVAEIDPLDGQYIENMHNVLDELTQGLE
jgi:zinc transport system substrate-binding protein